jgi:hypothetical protein
MNNIHNIGNDVIELRSKALKNIKKVCKLNNNKGEFKTIKNKLSQKEKTQGKSLSISFYQNFYNLSITQF